MAMIDTHCHLASHQFEGEVSALISRAQDAGVKQMISLGTTPDDWQQNLELAKTYPNTVFCALGLHPCSVTEVNHLEDAMSELESLAREHSLVALGETGLDYFHPAPDGWSEEAYQQRQQECLRAHFELSKSLKLPIVLHSRDRKQRQSLRDALDIAREFKGQVRAQFHCYLGPWDELAKEIIALDGIVSFGGIASFPSAKETTLAAAKSAPQGSFCLETDAPYLAPVPHRGKRNEPAFLTELAQKLATERGESLETFTQHTTQCAKEFFSL